MKVLHSRNYGNFISNHATTSLSCISLSDLAYRDYGVGKSLHLLAQYSVE